MAGIAVPLLQLRTELHPQSKQLLYSSITVDEGTKAQLTSNFAGLSNVVPVLLLGHSMCGKRHLADQLAGLSSFADSQLESEISCCPVPLPLGNANLLLLKQKGFSEFTEELQEKVLLSLLSIVGTALLCVEKSSTISIAKKVLRIWQEAREVHPASCSRLLLLVEALDSYKKGKNKTDFDSLQSLPLANEFELAERGPDDISPNNLATLKSTLTEAIRNRESAFGPKTIQDWFATVGEIAYKFEFCPTYTDFRDCESDCEFIRRDREMAKTMSAMRLMSREHGDIAVNPAAFEELYGIKGVDLSAPTSVLMILGTPGQGKSTLLNNIAKALLRLNSAPEFFKTANTTTHTTRESEMMHGVLHLRNDLQVLLIDLEGLGGLETENKRVKELQRLLVAALVAIASVPCILIKNELNAIEFFKEKLQEIASHKKQFALEIEKINLLFFDKEENAGVNQHWLDTIQQLQAQFGLQNTNIEIINKPSFVSSPPHVIAKFLKSLLASSAFPKRNVQGQIVNLQDIFKNIAEIVDSCRKISDLILSPEETRMVDAVVESSKKVIDRIPFDIICLKEITSISEIFVAKVRDVVEGEIKKIEESFGRQRIGIKRMLESRLTDQAEPLRIQLLLIENLAKSLLFIDASEILATCFKFQAYTHEPTAMLLKVKYHYPVLEKKIASVLAGYNSWRKVRRTIGWLMFGATGSFIIALFMISLRNRSSVRAKLTAQKASIFKSVLAKSSGLFFGSATLSLLQQTSEVPQAISNAQIAAKKMIGPEILSIISGLFAGLAVTSCFIDRAINRKAVVKGAVAVASGLMAYMTAKWMRRREIATAELMFVPGPLKAQYHSSSESDIPVIIVLGMKSNAQRTFVEQWMLWCYPYALLQSKEFVAKGQVQLLPFAYVRDDRLSQGLLINIDLQPPILLSENTLEKTIGQELIGQASQALIFVDNAQKFVQVISLMLGHVPPAVDTSCILICEEETAELRECRERIQWRASKVEWRKPEKDLAYQVYRGTETLQPKNKTNVENVLRKEIGRAFN